MIEREPTMCEATLGAFVVVLGIIALVTLALRLLPYSAWDCR